MRRLRRWRGSVVRRGRYTAYATRCSIVAYATPNCLPRSNRQNRRGPACSTTACAASGRTSLGAVAPRVTVHTKSSRARSIRADYPVSDDAYAAFTKDPRPAFPRTDNVDILEEARSLLRCG